jgi:hypothetical protein
LGQQWKLFRDEIEATVDSVESSVICGLCVGHLPLLKFRPDEAREGRGLGIAPKLMRDKPYTGNSGGQPSGMAKIPEGQSVNPSCL